MVGRKHAALSLIVLLLGIAALWLGFAPVTAQPGAGVNAPTPAALPAATEVASDGLFLLTVRTAHGEGAVEQPVTATLSTIRFDSLYRRHEVFPCYKPSTTAMPS